MTKTRSLIAVVDDEEPIRKALSRLIRSAGMDVETFPSGAELLDAVGRRIGHYGPGVPNIRDALCLG